MPFLSLSFFRVPLKHIHLLVYIILAQDAFHFPLLDGVLYLCLIIEIKYAFIVSVNNIHFSVKEVTLIYVRQPYHIGISVKIIARFGWEFYERFTYLWQFSVTRLQNILILRWFMDINWVRRVWLPRRFVHGFQLPFSQQLIFIFNRLDFVCRFTGRQ